MYVYICIKNFLTIVNFGNACSREKKKKNRLA